jgi:hypothetical protein
MRQFSIFILFAIIALPFQAWAADGIGVVRTLNGKAIVIRGDKEISAKKDMVIMQKDAIETGKNGTIGITFKDNTVFSMGPDSAIEIQDYVFDSGKFKGAMTVKMNRGTMTAVSGDIPKGSPGAMRIKTPTAVLAVRGTRFVIKVDPDD